VPKKNYLADIGWGIKGWPRAIERLAISILVVTAVLHGTAFGVSASEDQLVRAASASLPPTAENLTKRESGLDFETSAHRAWYGVFWTGKCDELPFLERMTCMTGRPTWSEVTQMVLSKTPPDARRALHDRMIMLGRSIGFEWSRSNDERRIDTDDLQRWSDWLKESGDVAGTVDRLAETIRGRLNQQ
jgi:hypothetical protein